LLRPDKDIKCHGHRLRAIAVKEVSTEFEKVRTEQKNCQGLTRDRASWEISSAFHAHIDGFGNLHTVVQAARLSAPYTLWAHFQVKKSVHAAKRAWATLGPASKSWERNSILATGRKETARYMAPNSKGWRDDLS
jgi:hypothetical protein